MTFEAPVFLQYIYVILASGQVGNGHSLCHLKHLYSYSTSTSYWPQDRFVTDIVSKSGIYQHSVLSYIRPRIVRIKYGICNLKQIKKCRFSFWPVSLYIKNFLFCLSILSPQQFLRLIEMAIFYIHT